MIYATHMIYALRMEGTDIISCLRSKYIMRRTPYIILRQQYIIEKAAEIRYNVSKGVGSHV